MIHSTHALVKESKAARPLFDPVESDHPNTDPSHLAYFSCCPVNTYLMAEALVWRDMRTLTNSATILDRLAVEVIIVGTTALAALELIARVALTVTFLPCVFFNKTEDVFYGLLTGAFVNLITIPCGIELIVSNCFSKLATDSKSAQIIVDMISHKTLEDRLRITDLFLLRSMVHPNASPTATS